MHIGDRIIRLRKEKGRSQNELAKMLGTSGPIFGRYERNEMLSSVEVAKKLADAFETTLDYLVDEIGKQAEIKDKSMLNRVLEIEHLDQDVKKTILCVIDSLLHDAKARRPMQCSHNLAP